MFLSKTAHCGGREGAAAGADAPRSVPTARGKTTFAQSGGLLMWSGPNEYLLWLNYPGLHFKN